MARKDPSKVAAKWSSNLAGSTESIKDGVNGVTVAPTVQAANNIGAMKARFNAAIDSGKTERALRQTSLSDWSGPMLEKGLPRIADGATKAQPKVEKFMGQLLPFTEAVSKKIAALPNATPQDRKNRMLANFDEMSKFQYNRR